jgi:uncharacterized protein
MPHRYLQELTTESVTAARERYGSRTAIERMTARWDTDAVLDDDAAGFIAERDGFYLATVGQTGWPYVQYRGGAPGFLHLLEPDEENRSVLAWADLRGNRQYVSVGNITASPRVSLFLMDYAHQQRLKIIGTTKTFDVRDDVPDKLAERLATNAPDGVVERIITVTVHGYDWNCPQHITPRYTEAELAGALTPVREELTRLRAENAALRRQLAPMHEASRPR